MTILPGRFILAGGPFGSGKSSLGRSALRAEGGGLILLAPGQDERSSYAEFEGRDEYRIEGFDDANFLPALGAEYRKATAFTDCLKFMSACATAAAERYSKGEPPRFPVVVVDTVSSFATLGTNAMLADEQLDAPPSDREGIISFWTRYRGLMQQWLRPLRALRGFGSHLILLTHVGDKVQKETGLAAGANAEGITTERAKTGHVPLIPGAFRDELLGYPEVILHSRVRAGGITNGDYNDPVNPRFVVQWRSSPERLSKSRIGPLNEDGRAVRNEWPVLKQAMEAALVARAATPPLTNG